MSHKTPAKFFATFANFCSNLFQNHQKNPAFEHGKLANPFVSFVTFCSNLFQINQSTNSFVDVPRLTPPIAHAPMVFVSQDAYH